MMYTMGHPAQVIQTHENRVNDALQKADQIRQVREVNSTSGRKDWALRQRLESVWDWHWWPFHTDHARPV